MPQPIQTEEECNCVIALADEYAGHLANVLRFEQLDHRELHVALSGALLCFLGESCQIVENSELREVDDELSEYEDQWR